MAGEFLLVTQFLAAAAMLGLAGWLLWLKVESAVNRSFAAALALRGGIILMNGVRELSEDPKVDGVALVMREYFALLLTVALLYFLVAYFRPARSGLWRGVRWGILAFGILATWLYAWDHCLGECEQALGRGIGPLGVLARASTNLIPGILAFAFAWEHRSSSNGHRRQTAYLMATAFGLLGLLETFLLYGLFAAFGIEEMVASYTDRAWSIVVHVAWSLAVVPSLAALVLLQTSRRMPRDGRTRVALAVTAGLVAGVGFLAGYLPATRFSVTWTLFLVNLARLLLPALVAFALVRHQLFGIEVKARFVIKQSTVAAVFLAVFFIVTVTAENFLTDRFGWAIGGVVAGLILFAIAPLQRLGERIAKAAFPDGPDPQHLKKNERFKLYSDQAHIAWQDGVLGRRERELLDQLQERLSIRAEDAQRLEKDALQASKNGPSPTS